MDESAASPDLAGEWVEWVATNLLAGEPASDIVDGLIEEGIGRESAERWVREVAGSPIVRGAASVARRARRAEMILQLERTRMRSLVIEARDDMNAEAFHRHYRATNRPVLLPAFTDGWPAREWSFESFVDRFDGVSIQATQGRESDPEYDRNHASHTYQTTIGEFVARMNRTGETNDIYVVAHDEATRSDGLAPLVDDLRPPPGFFQRGLETGTALWLGPAGTVTPLHHDQSDIVFCQFVGKKRIRLIAPSELAVAEAAHGFYGPSPSAFATDERLKDVTQHELVLGPGDTLFIPFGWWHEVTALEPSISVAINAFDDSINPWYAPGAV